MRLPYETQIESMEHKSKIYIIGAGVSGLIPAVAGISLTHSRPLQNHTDRRCWFAAKDVAEPTNNI